LTTDGSVYIWGDTPNGLLTRTEKINGLQGMVDQVAIGENFITVLDTDNSLFSWGGNEYGQLGIGDFEP
jgi:alpha-tubulin suppressor-like RCC1 family protein